MKQVITLIGLLLTMSCSVFKHKTENSSSHTDLAVHSVQRKDSLQLTAQTQHIRYLSDDQLEVIEIIPEGTFFYKPDSGFAGAATRVRIYRQHQQRSIDQDTSKLSLTAITNRVGVDSIVHHQQKRQVEETKKSNPMGIWVYLLVALGVLGVVSYNLTIVKKKANCKKTRLNRLSLFFQKLKKTRPPL